MIDFCNYLGVQQSLVTTLSSTPLTPALRLLTAHWSLGRALGEHLNPLLAQHYGLELRAYLILSGVARGVTYPSDLADRFGLPRDTTSRALQTLLKKGLITKRIDPDDSRRIQQNVTPAGEALLAEVRATLETLLEPLLQDFEPEALEIFFRTSETLKAQLTERLGKSRDSVIQSR